jgi:hypothetical protein
VAEEIEEPGRPDRSGLICADPIGYDQFARKSRARFFVFFLEMESTAMRNPIVPLVVLALAVSAAGCGSFSASSESSSAIVSSPFTSSSNSSSPENAYREEVADFTGSYLKSGGDMTKLDQQIGAIAEKRGISDWENNQSTYVGIGRGLRAAGVNEAQFNGYKTNLAKNEQQGTWLQDGFEQGD